MADTSQQDTPLAQTSELVRLTTYSIDDGSPESSGKRKAVAEVWQTRNATKLGGAREITLPEVEYTVE
jgi:hypothetical protein